jgi:hypothetical protein
VAMLLALRPEIIIDRSQPGIAGVFASSAGFPDGAHDSVPFSIFGSAGTDDFNHSEMFELDATVTSPHRIEVFDGAHTWLPAELATDGVEWMEIEAMKKNLRPRDQALFDAIFAKRVARADAQSDAFEKLRELKSIVTDFQGYKDISAIKSRVAAMEHQADVDKAERALRLEEEREATLSSQVNELRDLVANGDNIAELKALVLKLNEQSKAAQDSSDRRVARRVLGGLRISSGGIRNPEFRALMNELRTAPPAQATQPPAR